MIPAGLEMPRPSRHDLYSPFFTHFAIPFLSLLWPNLDTFSVRYYRIMRQSKEWNHGVALLSCFFASSSPRLFLKCWIKASPSYPAALYLQFHV